MFSRVILRRMDPATAGRADDIESQPLSTPPERTADPEMSEGSRGGLSRLMPRRPTGPSRFRFSSSTNATSAAASEWPADSQTVRSTRAHTHPALRPSSSHYPDDDESVFDHNSQHQSTLPSRYSVIVDLPSTRLHLPGLQRSWSIGSNGPPTSRLTEIAMPPSEVARPPPSPACRPHTPPPPFVPGLILTPPQQAHQGPTTRLGSFEADALYQSGDSRSRGAFTDPAEAQLAHMADDGRRRRERSGSSGRFGRRHRGQHRRVRSDETPEQREERRQRRRERRQQLRDAEDVDEESSARPQPKHFLFCFPWIKSRKIRSQILQCFVSGSFLFLLLGVYLALSATKNITNTEFSVLLILIILFACIFFCQGIIRLCLLIFKPKPSADQRQRSRMRQMYGPGGYAVPRQPIRVVLARDEEAAGIESEATKTSPPAYGLWRESVRVDPNRLFWQRNEAPPLPSLTTQGRGAGSETEGGSSSDSSGEADNARRPPSYASEDGVSYLIEAQPRSTVALGPQTVAMPDAQPLHPSEMGRSARPPSR